MSQPTDPTPYDRLKGLMRPPVSADEAEARKLGVTLDEYRVMKPQLEAEQARWAGTPPDIAAEAAKAERMRREPGIIKRRNETPNLLVQAAKTPGEVAQMILFVVCYILLLVGVVAIWGEQLRKVPGLFQFVGLGVLILPAMWLASRIWSALGEGARDGFRLLVRFWPLTLIVGFFLLLLLKVLLLQRRS
jgi:hypothetical protein